jgi:hypothetical protein
MFNFAHICGWRQIRENLKTAFFREYVRYGTDSLFRQTYDLRVKSKELTPEQILSVPCNTCGAAIGEACELHSSALRTEPHRDRKLSAADAVEAKPTNHKGG